MACGCFYSELIRNTRICCRLNHCRSVTILFIIIVWQLFDNKQCMTESDGDVEFIAVCRDYLFFCCQVTCSLFYSMFLLTVLHVFCSWVEHVCNMILLCSCYSQCDLIFMQWKLVLLLIVYLFNCLACLRLGHVFQKSTLCTSGTGVNKAGCSASGIKALEGN